MEWCGIARTGSTREREMVGRTVTIGTLLVLFAVAVGAYSRAGAAEAPASGAGAADARSAGDAPASATRQAAAAASGESAPATRASAVATKKTVDYNRDVRPILSDNCFYCHGHDPGHREAKLRLDTKEGLFGVRDDTYPIVPGKPDDSIVYTRITSDDPEYRMPHHKSNKKLTPQQIETVRKWIEEGAEWSDYWAYNAPQRPPVPTTVPTTVPSTPNFTPHNDIDKFVLNRLAESGLAPAREADKRTLIRRLTLDLTGLPPTSEDVESFVADTAPDAYDKLVDKLLASPHYGERMSVMWMDLVRYADTIGFHSDNPRAVYPWRDWCIQAFNDNKKFDEFTIEQIAGDLLPGATRDQKVASGYNRLLLTTGEGGAQAKEYVQKYLADRVRNVSTTWMGATMGCAQCHDHKFDPYTQKDFYRMGAFFADLQEPAIALPQPELMLPDDKQQAELARLDGALAAANAKLNTTTPQLAAAQEQWEKKALEAVNDPVKWTPLQIVEARSEGGAKMNLGKEKRKVFVTGAAPATDTYVVRATTKLKNITALRIDALPHAKLPAQGPGRAANGNFVLTEIDVTADKGAGPTTRPIAFDAASASHEQTSYADGENPYRRWTPVAAIDGDKFGPKWGWAILDRAGQPNHAVFQLAADLGTGEEVTLTIRLTQNLGDKHTLGHFMIQVTDAARPVQARKDSGIPGNIVAILKTPPEKRTSEQKDQLAAHYRSIAPELAPVRQEIASLNGQRTALVAAIPKTLFSVSGPPRVVRVLPRGNWQDDSGEVVAPGVPAFMKQVETAPDRGPSRLDLARWLVARDNPLTARVFVNRVWKMFFGQGLVKPLDDFGAQSEYPTHPQLLDWLAVEFMDSGWDVKHLVRLVVTSGSYRMSSTASKESREKDPYNKLVAHQDSFRLDAEFVRDNALAISGLLVDKIGGPSVKPYQPAGYWEFLNFPKREYDQDHGEKIYRRGMYTWWQRTFLNPSLLNFDAPSHEECVAERTRSNTPQQALTLLNDPTYVEAARVFAAKILTSCNGDDAARITWAYQRALARPPTPAEVPVLTALLKKQRERYRFDLAAANAITDVGEAPPPAGAKTVELAAWTSVARTILNLHETITRN
jgi:hypothetical protein